MCHLVFLVPLVGIPLFWLLPMGYALPINAMIWIVTGILGYKVVKAMTMPAEDGFKSLVGAEGTVVSTQRRDYDNYVVRAKHELWTARSAETLRPGERVEIAATDGIKLVVKRTGLKKE